MKNVLVFIFIALITLINADATIKISTPSVSTCEKGLAKVTLEATLEGSTSSQTLNFNMTLVDDGRKEYMATCRVELAGNITSSEDIDASDEETGQDRRSRGYPYLLADHIPAVQAGARHGSPVRCRRKLEQLV